MTENTMIAFYSTCFKNKIKLAMVVIYNMVDKFNTSYNGLYPNHFASIDNATIKQTFILRAKDNDLFSSSSPPSFKGRFEGSSSKPDFLRFTFTDARQTQATPSKR